MSEQIETCCPASCKVETLTLVNCTVQGGLVSGVVVDCGKGCREKLGCLLGKLLTTGRRNIRGGH